MSISEVQIGEFTYRCGEMLPRKQWHVAIKMLPFIQGLMPLLQGADQNLTPDENGNLVPDLSRINVFAAVAALANTLGMMPLEDVDMIIDTALEYVRWRQGDRWVPLRASGGGPFMLGAADRFDVQMRLVWEVLRNSLWDFSPATAFGFPQTNGLDRTPLSGSASSG